MVLLMPALLGLPGDPQAGSLSKPGDLGGSPGMVMGCLEVAGTRHMALHKRAGLWLEKEEGWVPSRRGGDGGLCLPL